MVIITACLVALAAYLLGSVSGAIIISKSIGGEDIRSKGSKNAGTTNMLRVYGKKYAVITLLIDVLKGVAAVLIGMLVDYAMLRYTAVSYGSTAVFMKYIAAVFVVLGHDFPLYFGFRGGKGVATSIGAAMMLDWRVGLIVMLAALLIMAVSRYVSLGSIIGAIVYPFAVLAFMLGKGEFDMKYLVCSIILALLIVVKHKANIVRLKNGTENKLFSKKVKKEAE